MICPKCFSRNTHVTNTRLKYGGRYRWRVRICKKCGYIFNTYEMIEDDFKRLVKNND